MSLLSFARSVVHERRAVGSIGTGSVQFIDGSCNIFDDGKNGPTVRRVVGYGPVSQILQMLGGDLAKLPVMVYDQLKNGRVAQPKHPLLNLVGLFGHPNDIDTTFDLLFNWFFFALLYGRSAIWVRRAGPDAIELLPLLPDRTYPVYFGGKRYFQTELRGDGEPRIEYIPDNDVLYLQYLTLDGLHPEHPVRLYRSTFDQAINAQDFTSKFFLNGNQQGGIIAVPPGAGETAIRNVEAQIKARSDKENWFRTLVLKDGFKWQGTTFSLRDSTAVELDDSTARQVARIYNVPGSRIGLRDTVSYNSLSADSRQYLDSCLSSWLIQARSQFHRKLLLPREQKRFVVDYQVDETMWIDPSQRASVGMLGVQNKFIDVNTVRGWFGQPPIDPSTIPAQAPPNQGMQNAN